MVLPISHGRFLETNPTMQCISHANGLSKGGYTMTPEQRIDRLEKIVDRHTEELDRFYIWMKEEMEKDKLMKKSIELLLEATK